MGSKALKLFMLFLTPLSFLGLIGCLINNGMTKGFLGFPYAIALGSCYFYFKKDKSKALKVALISYVLCVVLNPLANKLMDSKANEDKFQLVFIKEAYLIKLDSKGQQPWYDIQTQAEIDSTLKILNEHVGPYVEPTSVTKLYTFSNKSVFPHHFERDLTSWIDGEMYYLDVSSYVEGQSKLQIKYGGINMGGGHFLEERFLELYKNSKVYNNYSGLFVLSQSANWPVVVVGTYMLISSLFRP